jgi:quercetin dioxygenase-like cupin family protein
MTDERPLRRVVTGHDAENRAKMLIDGPVTNVMTGHSGSFVHQIWSTGRHPADNAAGEAIDDAGAGPIVPVPPRNGTRFMVVDYAPGNHGRMHRTETVDYVIVLAGAIDLELDAGATVHLETGDVLVQRGTVHAWLNRGSETARVACVLVDAEPLGLGQARTLENADGGTR